MQTAQTSPTGLAPALVRATVAGLVVAAICAAGMLAITLNILAWGAQEGDTLPTTADLEQPVRAATMLLWLVAGALWAAWFARALTAAARFGALRSPVLVSVGLLFVPVANWVVGKRAVNDIYRVTAGSASPRPGPIVQAWWAMTILFTVALFTAFVLQPADAEYFEDQVASYRADAIAYGLAVVAATIGAISTAQLSRRISAAQASLPAEVLASLPREPAALVATRRAPLAVRAVKWAAWGIAAIAVGYVAVGAAAWTADPDPDALVAIEAAVVLPLSLGFLLATVLWLLWYYAAVAAYRSDHGGPSAVWLTAAWFIPPFFLVTPWRALGRLLDASPNGSSARSALRGAWVCWVLSLAATIPGTVSIATGPPEDLATWRWYAPVSALAYALAAATSFALVTVTRAVASERQPAAS